MAYSYKDNSFYNGQQDRPPKKDNSDIGSWLLIGGMFLVGLWPVGLILLISKLSETVQHSKPRVASRAMPASRAAQSTAQQRRDSAVHKVTKTPTYSVRSGRIMQIIGIVLAVLGLAAMASELQYLPYYMEYSGWAWDLLRELFYPTGMLCGGVALMIGSGSMKRRARRFGTYLACAGNREAIALSMLAGAAGVSTEKAGKDVALMLEKGLWGESAYVDRKKGMLFRSPASAEAYYQQQERATAQADVPQQAEEGYSGTLRAIRRANDRIADPELSAKIDRLESVAGRIFKIIEEQPAKRERAGTFLNYYLPTTQKLLDSYADFEEAGVSGENLSSAKDKIRQTMDNVIAGFEHQLDELYRDTAMDIDSDIRVMETLLRRDSASAAADFGLDGGTAVQSPDTEIE